MSPCSDRLKRSPSYHSMPHAKDLLATHEKLVNWQLQSKWLRLDRHALPPN
eukprot:m.5663 g.5663  ORF g.5663 m.5663 type:complete len:51 (-) comp7837_c0_seq3:22-174(-)